MPDKTEEIWKWRYRELENQFEYLLINVAEVLEGREAPKSKEQSRPSIELAKPKILKVVKTSKGSESYVYCVANGNNMEYRFEIFGNKQLLQDTGYTRLNSSEIQPEHFGKADTCRVSVKSDYNGKRHEHTAHTQIKWGR